MGVALTVTMVGVPVGTASAASATSSSKHKTVKKSSKKISKKASKKVSKKKASKKIAVKAKSSKKKAKLTKASASPMKDGDSSLNVIFARPAEGIQMEGPARGEKAASIAKRYIGYSYVWGGASPSTGFDCSGLTQYVYKKAGVKIWRTAQDQYNFCKKLKNKVKKDDIVKGDLLFFGSNTSSISHVGIYIGNGKFVHASTPATGVKVTKLSQRTNWVAAGRPYEN